jgi:Mannitol repressor
MSNSKIKSGKDLFDKRTKVWELLYEESDRGCVLVSASFLDENLKNLLKQILKRKKLSNNKIKDLTNANGPLGTFSSRIVMSYVFDIISCEVYENLEIIRAIRNDFAHSSDRTDFSQSDLETRVRSMKSSEYPIKEDLLRFCPEYKPEVKGVIVNNKEFAIGRIMFSLHVSGMLAEILKKAKAIEEDANK